MHSYHAPFDYTWVFFMDQTSGIIVAVTIGAFLFLLLLITQFQNSPGASALLLPLGYYFGAISYS